MAWPDDRAGLLSLKMIVESPSTADFTGRKSADAAAGASRTFDVKAHDALVFIADTCVNPGLRLRTVARHVALSEGDLARRLKRWTDYGFVHHRRSIRMAKAEPLMMDSLLSMKEIAFKVGYNHLGHFDRDFRRTYGCSPTEWRKRHRDASDTAPGSEVSKKKHSL